MRRSLLLPLLLALVGCHSRTAAPAAPKLETDDQKTLYALGQTVGRNLEAFSLSPAELDIVKSGLTDHVAQSDAKVPLDTFGPKIQSLAQGRMAKRSEEIKGQAKTFLVSAAKEKGAQELPSGLIYLPIKEGTGQAPNATDRVKVHYQGTLTDGTSSTAPSSANSRLNLGSAGSSRAGRRVCRKMKVGGKAKLVCPSSLAYGDRGQPPKIPGGAALSFDVELLEILPPLPPGGPGAPGADPHAGVTMMGGGMQGHGGMGHGGPMMPPRPAAPSAP